MNQPYLYLYMCVYVCMFRPTPLGHPQSTKLSPPCYMGASHQLSVLHMVVYICLCYSLNSSHLLPHPCVHYVKTEISKDFVLVGPVQIWYCKWQCFYWTSSMPCLCFSSTRRILILRDARDVRLSHSYFFVPYTQLTMLILPPRYCWKQLFHACSLPILLLFFFFNHTSFFTSFPCY